jgi:hypothetical protein
MKKIILILIIFVSSGLLMVSCDLFTTDEKTFDETLLYGKWQSGTLFYNYLSDGNGSTWDTSDDVTEAEAQKFTWTLVKSELTQNHILEMGGTVPKVYTITELTDSTLKYHDDFDKSYSFTKVK